MARRLGSGATANHILAALALGGFLIVAATLPGITKAIYPLLKKKNPYIKKRAIEQSLRRLRERRLVEWKISNGKPVFVITERGKQRVKFLDLEELKLPNGRWDGNWTVILFDIPERKGIARRTLSHKLKSLGCFQLHKSVYVYPWECEDEIDFIAETFEVGQYVTVFRTSSLGRHEHLAQRNFEDLIVR